ncbi:zinc-binding dehydrogenase [Nocardia nova]|uniref:zinc-binding dehydrogenase n=1 Tax=Nocardia nova TaxID=37330 RepID=UPI00130ED744|nr:zinc-binding dehydrogenase [Nocardia nova]
MSFTIYFGEYGGALRQQEETLPEPGPGQVRIVNRAISSADDRVAKVIGLAERGVIRFPFAEHLPLADAARAFEISQGGHVRGKLILVP